MFGLWETQRKWIYEEATSQRSNNEIWREPPKKEEFIVCSQKARTKLRARLYCTLRGFHCLVDSGRCRARACTEHIFSHYSLNRFCARPFRPSAVWRFCVPAVLCLTWTMHTNLRAALAVARASSLISLLRSVETLYLESKINFLGYVI